MKFVDFEDDFIEESHIELIKLYSHSHDIEEGLFLLDFVNILVLLETCENLLAILNIKADPEGLVQP